MNIFFWLLSLASMAAVIFANYPLMQIDTEATPLEFGLYDALSRVIWSVAISYIIFACVHGYGGFVNSFLSHALWQPFSRLSYSIYLSHLLVMTVTMATMKTPLYFSEMNAVSDLSSFCKSSRDEKICSTFSNFVSVPCFHWKLWVNGFHIHIGNTGI